MCPVSHCLLKTPIANRKDKKKIASFLEKQDSLPKNGKCLAQCLGHFRQSRKSIALLSIFQVYALIVAQ